MSNALHDYECLLICVQSYFIILKEIRLKISLKSKHLGKIRLQVYANNNKTSGFVSVRYKLTRFSKFSAPTIAFLAF